MDEKEIRKRIKVLTKKYDVLASIPERAGSEGEEEAIEIFYKHRERIINSEDPLRISKNDNAFVFGQAILIKCDSGYLNDFVIMSQRFDNILDIIGMNL